MGEKLIQPEAIDIVFRIGQRVFDYCNFCQALGSTSPFAKRHRSIPLDTYELKIERTVNGVSGHTTEHVACADCFIDCTQMSEADKDKGELDTFTILKDDKPWTPETSDMMFTVHKVERVAK
tara:strand:- start:164 stop:529 length:366 start_codon:yes stop_codon:yes gene_type:complete